jgi:hypothetical protein
MGFILLNAEIPSEREILIPARERPAIDGDSANRLAGENSDFLKFLREVRRFHQKGGDIVNSDWP